MAEKGHRIQRIVIGLDGSKQSAAALSWAIAMARGMGAEIVAVYVLDNPMDLSMGMAPVTPLQYDPEWRAAMEVTFEREWCAPLAESGLAYRTVVADGRPASEITRVADEEGADVVVVGRRGRGGVAELLLGSVSHEVAQHCKRPVLLISE
jgi:nucleotide-binding universal stress UspA family protein